MGTEISNFLYTGVKSDEKSKNDDDVAKKLHLWPLFWKNMQYHFIYKCTMRPNFTESVYQTGGGYRNI